MAVKELKSGHYYKWIGSKKRPDDWNDEGNMDFMLDGKPHLCIEGGSDIGVFPDSRRPDWEWIWGDALANFVDCGTNARTQSVATGIAELEERVKELEEAFAKQKIVSIKKVKYDSDKMYVGIQYGKPYLMIGCANNRFGFYTLEGTNNSDSYAVARMDGQECINYHIKAGFAIYEFESTTEALSFFMDYL